MKIKRTALRGKPKYENEGNWPLEVSLDENEENWPLEVSSDKKIKSTGS